MESRQIFDLFDFLMVANFPFSSLLNFENIFALCVFNFFLVLPVNELIFQWMISGSISVVLIKCELESLFK